MTSNDVARWRNSREWLNGGECCGDKDSDGICAAPACIFGEAVKELQLAADRIEKLEAALRELSTDWDCCVVSKNMKLIARKALEGKDD
jgi:hypothetical protein